MKYNRRVIYFFAITIFSGCTNNPKVDVCGSNVWKYTVKSEWNELTLCKNGDLGSFKIYHLNFKIPSPPTTCNQIGTAIINPDKKITFALKRGRCRNGNYAPPVIFECVEDENILRCLDIKKNKTLDFKKWNIQLPK